MPKDNLMKTMQYIAAMNPQGSGKKKRSKKGRGIFGDIGGMLGSKAGNMLGGVLGFGKKKRRKRGRGGVIVNQNPGPKID